MYWHKVYNIPELSRDAKGRNLVNLLNLDAGETIADCRAIKDFDLPDHFLIMATRNGLVKKTVLSAYSRPLKSGLIAIKLREGDELIDVNVCGPGDEIVLSTSKGRAIRFRQSDIRPMGRNTSGVKGISLRKGDHVVGMVIADESAQLLTVCANGFGKRTPFGPNGSIPEESDQVSDDNGFDSDDELKNTEQPDSEPEGTILEADGNSSGDTENGTGVSSSFSYRTQRRGGGGVIDIKTSQRNGPVIGIARVDDDDEIMMMTARGKIQRIAVNEVRIVARNTQGVRVMNVDDEDTLVAIHRIPKDDSRDEKPETGETPEE